ncbi:MAG: rubredoxin [Phormidesmis sp.]
MSIEPNSSQTPPEPARSLPLEETIPLVKSDVETEQNQENSPPTPAEMDQFECRSCGYTYEPAKGDNRNDIPAGVEFKALPNSWRCPVCGASTTQFSNVGPAGAASGFKANLSYGFGVNTLTPGQKNLLIFGALGLGVLFFLSLYGLQ